MSKSLCRSSSEWEYLPAHLIDSILEKLILLSDYIRFGAVCKSWKSLAKNHYKQKQIHSSNHQLPRLIVSERRNENFLYSFTNDKISDFQLPLQEVTLNKICFGSSHGWLFFLDDASLVLWNPLSRTSIRLPRLNSTIVVSPLDGVGKIALSRDPCLGCFEVLVASSSFDAVAYFKSGDEFWTYLESDMSQYVYFDDVVFYKDRLLSASNINGTILSLEVFSNGCSKSIKVEKIAEPGLQSHDVFVFFVENTDGELLIVHRYFKIEFCTYKSYEIYKLVGLASDKLELLPIKHLGGDCLILANATRSISILSRMCSKYDYL